MRSGNSEPLRHGDHRCRAGRCYRAHRTDSAVPLSFEGRVRVHVSRTAHRVYRVCSHVFTGRPKTSSADGGAANMQLGIAPLPSQWKLQEIARGIANSMVRCLPTVGISTSAGVWWQQMPARDNVWWDCVVGNCVAASMLGCSLTGETLTKTAEARTFVLPRGAGHG